MNNKPSTFVLSVTLVIFFITLVESCETSSLTCADIQSIATANFPSQYVNDMICIAYYESSWCPSDHNNGTYYGLWQVNTKFLGKEGCPSTAKELLDPTVNAQCAAQILSFLGLEAFPAWNDGQCRKWNKCIWSTSSSSATSKSTKSSTSSTKSTKSSTSSSSSSSSSTSTSSTGSGSSSSYYTTGTGTGYGSTYSSQPGATTGNTFPAGSCVMGRNVQLEEN